VSTFICANDTAYSSSVADGLSIPFFSAGRNIHSHTLSLTATFTSRSPFAAPEWLSAVRRVPQGQPLRIDVERAEDVEERQENEGDKSAGTTTPSGVGEDVGTCPAVPETIEIDEV
jgi:hypothetical protein